MMSEIDEEERRLTPEEFRDALIRFQKSRPVVMDETEYAVELDQTTVLRYAKGLDILDGVIAEIREQQGRSVTLDADKLAKSIDDAVVAFGYGHLGHNRCGRANKGAHSRVVLWYDPHKT